MVQQDVALAQRGEDVRRGGGLDLGQVAVRCRRRTAGTSARAGPAPAMREQPGQVERPGQRVHLGVGASSARAPAGRARRGSMDSSTSSRTGGPKRRRISSFSSAWRRFSASSSSTSRSSLRVTRNMWCVEHLHAGEQLLQVRGDDVLQRDVPLRGRLQEARQQRRHLDPREVLVAADRVAHDDGEVQRQPGDVRERVRRVHGQRGEHREDLLPEEGEQPGLLLLASARPSGPGGCPRRPARGRRPRWKQAACRAMSSRDRAQIRSSTSRGCSPEAERVATPVAMRRLRPATRTMKNSSRLLAKIARKFARSSSGVVRVLGQLEHPLVEREPAALAVQEPALRAARPRRAPPPRTRRGRRRGRVPDRRRCQRRCAGGARRWSPRRAARAGPGPGLGWLVHVPLFRATADQRVGPGGKERPGGPAVGIRSRRVAAKLWPTASLPSVASLV